MQTLSLCLFQSQPFDFFVDVCVRIFNCLDTQNNIIHHALKQEKSLYPLLPLFKKSFGRVVLISYWYFPIWRECSIYLTCFLGYFNSNLVSFWKVPDASFYQEKYQKMSTRDKLSCRNPCICSGDACLYGLRLCYSFSAISIGKLLYVYIIYTAIACTVVCYLDAVCCDVWFVRCVCAYLLSIVCFIFP